MTALRQPHAIALAAALLLAPAAHASGDYGTPRDELVSRDAADFERDQMLHGQVGIVLPTWDAPSQYLAWRAIVTAGKPAFRATAEVRAASDVPAGWTDAAASPAPAANDGGPAVPHFSAGYDRPNCSPDAQAFAGATLAALQKRADRTPARVDAWIAAQQQVFALCERDPLDVLQAADPIVAPLPASEPLYWRQLREYQMAAAAFYAAHYGQSRAAFERIGHTAGHPMQGWGAYLALRSHLRGVQVGVVAPTQPGSLDRPRGTPEQLADLDALRKEGEAILHDAALAPVHEATAATLRRAAYLLAPRRRFAELTAMLDDLKADPERDDALDDWPFMGYGTGDDAVDARALVALRAAHPWFDWVNTIARGADAAASAPARAASGACAGECAHALQAWSRGPAVSQGPDDAAAGQHRAWLLAALMDGAPLTKPVEREALAVLTRAPEYASVRYYLADRLAASGQADGARVMSEGLLARLRGQKPASPSAINLVTQQRFALATSVADASAYLLMSPVAATNPDTGERAAPADAAVMPSDDGARWLDRSLSVADLLAVARALPAPSPWRTRIAVAAWMRADLLGDAPAAEDASKLVEAWMPALKPVAVKYRALPAGVERQHWLIVNALKRGLSPDPVASYRDGDGQYPLQKPDETVADLWCHIGTGANSEDLVDLADPKARPQPPEVSADPARRDAERARLLKMHSATGFVGLHAIAWAESHPTDKDAAWLLYVAIQSSKGGCVDPDHTAISKKAWQVLHKRFPRSPWTEQSPYFY